MILPTVALALIPMGVITRMARASVLENLSQEFVMTLRAKGLWSRTITRHFLMNAAPPVLTLMGLQFGDLLGGSVLVETVFSWPGRGSLDRGHISARFSRPPRDDSCAGWFFVMLILLVDIVQSLVDPRIRRT